VYAQTPITDANFDMAINTCLTTNSIDGLCANSEYGAMPDWDVSAVTTMISSFYERNEFNADISEWDVSNVTDMVAMFLEATSFNQDISVWDVRNVTDMTAMFLEASSFNQDLSGWDVRNVTDMSAMFYEAIAFNQDLSDWDVSKVKDMAIMFSGATFFNQDLSAWDVSSVMDMIGIFSDSNMSMYNYDATLIGWAQLTLQQNVNLVALGVHYCNGETARQSIIDTYGWTVSDAGSNCATASVEDIENSLVTLYPNPTSDFLFITKNQKPVHIIIYNVLGKEVLSAITAIKVDVTSLPKGVYIMRFKEGVKEVRKKFVKS